VAERCVDDDLGRVLTGTELAMIADMATPQSTYALDRRGASQPAWLDDRDLEDDPPSPGWPFERVDGSLPSFEDALRAPDVERFATVPPPPRRSAGVRAIAVAAAMIMTFGVGWWAGQVRAPRDQEPSVARMVRSLATVVRTEADVAPTILVIATVPQAPAVTVSRSIPPPARTAAVAPDAPDALLAPEKPADTVAAGFVPTEL
jgi:hypothetical protein